MFAINQKSSLRLPYILFAKIQHLLVEPTQHKLFLPKCSPC